MCGRTLWLTNPDPEEANGALLTCYIARAEASQKLLGHQSPRAAGPHLRHRKMAAHSDDQDCCADVLQRRRH